MRIRKFALLVTLALSVTGGVAHAASTESHVKDFSFSFEGPFGTYDQAQLQRGLKIYTEVCSACHGMRYVTFRSLSDEGGLMLSKDDIRSYASENFETFDPATDDTRPANPTDPFPMSNNEKAPDLSLMAKARAGFHGPAGTGLNQLIFGMGGPEYIASLLTGYTGEEKEEFGAVLYENTAFPGGWIAMAPPLSGEDVDFDDGAPNDLKSESQDIAAFLMWTAEPKLDFRKKFGMIAVLLLTLLTTLLYLTNKKLWAPIKGKKTTL